MSNVIELSVHYTQLFHWSLKRLWCRILVGRLVGRVSKKCQLIFCSRSVQYEPISMKIGRNVQE